MIPRKTMLLKEVLLTLAVSVTVYVIARIFDLAEHLQTILIRNEKHELDELLIVLFVLPLIFGLFSHWRWKEVQKESMARREAEADAQKSRARLDNVLKHGPTVLYTTSLGNPPAAAP